MLQMSKLGKNSKVKIPNDTTPSKEKIFENVIWSENYWIEIPSLKDYDLSILYHPGKVNINECLELEGSEYD